MFQASRTWARRVISVLLALSACFLLNLPQTASAQTLISGDISGTVTDSSGAVVPNARVTVTSVETGQSKAATADAGGAYRVSLLTPGHYNIAATAQGFQTATMSVQVVAGVVTPANLQLTVGQASTTVQVVGTDVPLLHTDSADISTTFTPEQVQALPNPGNDLTFVAQTAPGSVMNTQGGYGNFSSFGLPATSNTFTVNGGYENDPFLNLNNSGATNLLLGNNDISSVSVISNAYDASFGGLGGAQVNEISRSGSNAFHGNATWFWNGRAMNANDWFNKHVPSGTAPTPRPFDNANQWAAGFGGPIKRDKSFFFVNYEGLRVILPTRGTVYAPSPAFQRAILGPAGSASKTLAPNGNLADNGNSAEAPLYQKIFSFYNNAPGAKSATPDASDPAVVDFNGTSSNFTHEYQIAGRVDQVLGTNDRLFGHVTVDKGVQATATNLLNPEFNAFSPQPQYEGQLGETHTFGANLINQFLFTNVYYRAIFTNTNQAKANADVPFTLVFLSGSLANDGTSALVGGANYDFPQGRNVEGYQFQDDVSWTRGSHTIKTGWTMRRDDVTDYDPGVRAVTPEAYVTEASLAAGFATRFRESFPQRTTQPVALYTMGMYVQDQWKASQNLTFTYGVRVEHNSNPICVTNCFAKLNGEFFSVAHSTSITTPYNQMISANQHTALQSFQAFLVEPRIGVAYRLGAHTTIRTGFGMFSDSFPGQIADTMMGNPPTTVAFYLRGNYKLDPSQAGSGAKAVAASNAAFRAGYAGGASYKSLSGAGIGFAAPSFTTPEPTVKYPTYEEWNLAVEHQLDRATAVSVQYVGNHGYHEPVLNSGVNAYGFGSLPATAPAPSFGEVTTVESAASSNYNGLTTSLVRRGKNVSLQFNYQWSHALDEISNGGFDGFSGDPLAPENPYNLAQNYGNADYDIRNYISANYVITIPHKWGPRVLTDGWTFGGTVFHSTGLPFTMIDSNSPVNYGGSLYAAQLDNHFSHHCGGGAAADNPCDFAAAAPATSSALGAHFDAASDFGQQRRNLMTGSGYTDTDLDAMKAFGIPRWEEAHLKLGAQFYNVFNHPNFGQPGNDIEASPGFITSTVNTPTSILGSFLGGDASPRLIQFKAEFQF